MSEWLNHLQSLLGRPLDGGDFIFPGIASTGKLKFGEPTSRSGFESLMDDIVDGSGVLKGRNGKFTTHCFRRGGAQYRFMWAPRLWSLKAVKWWGGWSSKDQVCRRASICNEKHPCLIDLDCNRSGQSCATSWMNLLPMKRASATFSWTTNQGTGMSLSWVLAPCQAPFRRETSSSWRPTLSSGSSRSSLPVNHWHLFKY